MTKKEIIQKKRMARYKKSFLILLVLCIGIGFAVVSTQLTITGTTNIKGNVWNTYLDNIQVAEGSIPASPPVITGDLDTVRYSVILDIPGDKYEFTVDCVNDGTIDVMIDSIENYGISSSYQNIVDYSVTYLDGSPIRKNDVLKSHSRKTVKISLKYKKDINNSDLRVNDMNFSMQFRIIYVQSTLKEKSFASFMSDITSDAQSDTSLDFTQISSDSNGKGLYVRNGTQNDTHPIYYYRGAVTNNNAYFAGICWKIVRTTNTGGVKLVYNGVPDSSGNCTNINIPGLTIRNKYNENYNSPAYVGYMYGTVYEYESGSTSSSHVYGNTFTYENGTYTLSDTHAGVDETHHYTCLSSSTSCESVKYVYNVSGSTAYYITLTGGKNIDDAFAEMNTNTNNSTIKTAVDNWFSGTFATYFTTNNKDYNDYLEDTVWCNDRSMNTIEATISGQTSAVNNGWKPNGGSTSNYLRYGAFGRMQAGTPILTCSNKNDSFTVSDTTNGNGALTYPAGLLTADEILLAGGANVDNTDVYLYNGSHWYSMSPYGFYSTGYAKIYSFHSYLESYNWTTDVIHVRPSISLKPGFKIYDNGDGTSTNPYVFIVD